MVQLLTRGVRGPFEKESTTLTCFGVEKKSILKKILIESLTVTPKINSENIVY